ncbi:S-layer homology domain-containing protein [Deinococcus lacus]|uniref:S-layer homology domain-containing protein n=1 Tax=Deinococcus lacus TaxID=392561 RepID=A0ABW1YAU3_9DEIO
MRKSLIIVTALALGMGAASAQTGTQTATQTITLTDVPAGHWARDAVETTVKAGLIQGFPDGTFRGNQNLTRYEAAMIFHRLLASGALTSGNVSDSDLVIISRGMQEVSAELAAISSRLGDVERLSVDQQARIVALEERIAALGSMDNTALTARIDALEAAVRAIPAMPASNTADLERRIAELEARLAGMTTTAPAPVSPAPVTEVPVTTTPGTEIVIDTPDVVVDSGFGSNMYVGIGGAYTPTRAVTANSNFQDTTGNYACLNPASAIKALTDKNYAYTTSDRVPYCASLFGTIGADQVVGPVGLRANVEYIPGRNNSIAGDINAMGSFDLGGVNLYAGAGVGAVNGASNGVANFNTKATDAYGNLTLGTDIRFSPSMGAFVEGNGKYYFSKNTVIANDSNNQFGIAARGGLKFFF